MSMRKIILIICLFVIQYNTAQVAKYSNEFLNVGVSARALAMANANIASVNDVSAGYWNPAGLLFQQSNLQLGLMHAEYFAGIAKYDYIAAAKRIDSNSVACLSFIRFGVDNIPNTLDLVDANGNVDYSRIKSFNAVDAAVLLSYARNIIKIKGLKIGGSFKVIRRTLGDFGGSWGFGMDIGGMYDYKKWRFAAMGRDITGTFNAWTYDLTPEAKNTFATTGNEIPNNSVEVTVPKLILGVTRKFYFWKERFSVLAEFNCVNTFDGMRNTVIRSKVWSCEPMLGMELGYKGFVYFRAGIGNIQKQLNAKGDGFETTYQPNMGVGIKYKVFALDYALTDIGDRSIALYSHIFSLKIDINKKFK